MQDALLLWFAGAARSLPFRETKDAYAIWVSEIMLQQTTVAAVTPYWDRFLKRFPTVTDLAHAPLDDVLHAWAGLGYYSRARNLHAAARAVVQRHGGRFPERYEDALALPGVGRYTAGAVCSFAYNQNVAAVDANAARVLSRLFAIGGDPRSPAASRALWNAAERILPAGRSRSWNLALFDLGAAICTPRAPRCLACPVSRWCEAFQQGRPEDFPQTPERPPMTARVDVAAVIRDAGGRVALAQRPAAGVWAGMWETPRGPLEPGEGEAEGLRRILRETHGVEIQVGALLAVVRHTVMRQSITLRAYEAQTVGAPPAQWIWAGEAEAGSVALPSPQRRLLQRLLAGRNAGAAGDPTAT
ncbi:MAG TPA: A/G-specific adenine glycosylase [Armatimonadota bacterium]|jgi:A/G-specific adenine glycosylase